MDRWVTFDCYGTLIDWERGIARALGELWPSVAAAELLADYHRHEAAVERGSAQSYRSVLRACVQRVAEARGLPLTDDDALARSLPRWPPFPETPRALLRIRGLGWRIAVLSNTDPDLLTSSVAAIGVRPDLLITVAEAGSYKPAHGHWRTLFERSRASPHRHVHVAASVYHDIVPSHALGLRAVWINRAGERSDVPRAAELRDLEPLPDVLERLVPV